MVTVSSTSSRTATTDASSAESTTTIPPSVEAHKPSISTPTIAAAVVVSILGAVAVFAFAYLLFRYCTRLKAKFFAYRGRGVERLSGEEDGEILPRGYTADMSEVNPSPNEGASTVRQSMTAWSSAANSAAVPGYPADLANVPVLSEKEPENHPFSNQVPLETSDVGSNTNIPNLRHSFILGMSMGMGSTTGSVSTRPPTYMTNESGSDPVNTIIHNYAAPSRSTSNRNSGGVHPTGLSANPPTPVVTRNNAGFVPRGASRQRSNTLSSSLIPSTPTPAYFPAPSPPESVLETPSFSRVRKSITPSESASNAPSSPLPFPVGLLVNTTLPSVPAPSRWSWNSSSIAVGSRKVEPAARRSESGSVNGMAADTGADVDVGPVSPMSTTSPLPLSLSGRRSSTASSISIMSSNSASRVSLRDMTR